MTYWKIGKYIAGELDVIGEEKYGSKIVSTVSRLLTEQFGKGYTRAGIFRMVKVARAFSEAEIVATIDMESLHRAGRHSHLTHTLPILIE